MVNEQSQGGRPAAPLNGEPVNTHERPARSVYRRIRISMVGLGALSGLVLPLLVGNFVLGEDHGASVLYTVVCVVACMAVGIGNYWLFNHYVSAELHRIVEAMKRINLAVARASETGDDLTVDHRLAITSDDDIGALEIHFNEMTDAIADRLNLAHRNRHLVTQVADNVNIAHVGSVVLEELRDAAEAAGGVLYGDIGGTFERLAITGFDDGEGIPRTLSPGDGPCARALRTSELIEMSPVEHGLDWLHFSTPLGTMAPRSVVIVPLHANDAPVGLVVLASTLAEVGARRRIVESLVRRSGQLLQNAILHEKVQKLAALDELTGVLNRRFGLRRLGEEFSVSLRHGDPISVLVMDIDHFKSFNDTFGHDAGDVVLKTFAKIIESKLRTSDIFCRYGGEEFLVVAPDTSAEDAGTLAERLRLAVESHRVPWQKQELCVTISIGIATWPVTRASSPDELITDADKALYHAKNAGRNRVAIHRGEGITVRQPIPKAA